MSDLVAIIRATRASANALARMQRYARKLTPMHVVANRAALQKAYQRAECDYNRAQITLARNPL